MAEQTRPSWRDVEARLIARAWKDEGFKRALLENPKAVLERHLGTELPVDLDVRVLEQPRDTLFLVLPPTPATPEGELSDEELEAAAGGRVKQGECWTAYAGETRGCWIF